ncbi:MAG: AI-2E family transporter [Gammaproteobacteria bacterium]|nr:AI-2E family transporter [Gammaproteobacteria bacterium]
MEELTEGKWLRRLLLAGLLAVLVLLAFQVLQPFIVPVIWSAILAYVTWPLHERMLKVCRGQRDVAAFLMTVLLSVCIVLPVVWLAVLVQAQALPVYRELAPLLAHRQLPSFVTQLPILGPRLQELYAQIATNPEALGEAIRGFLDQSSGELVALLGGVGRNLAKLVLAMVSLFFMFRDGEQFAAQVRRILEQFFGAVRVEHYLDAIGATVKAVVYGLVLAAFAQGTFAGLGYWVAGVPAPAFLGAITFLVGLVPFLVPFVWAGASLWLFLTGKAAAAIGLFIWGLTAVSWVDNLVRPLVISGATRIPFLMVMFGVLGGLAAFGLVGLFIGPVILAVLTAIWREWLAEKRAQG